MSFYPRLGILLYFLFLTFAFATAQDSTSTIDDYEKGLSKILNLAVHDTVRLASLFDAIDEKNHKFAEVSIKYIKQGIDLAHEQKLTALEAEFYDKLGWAYISLSQKDNSEVAHEKSLALFRSCNNVKRELNLLHTLIESYAINSAADKCLSHAYDALDICAISDDQNCLAQTYFRMAKGMYNFREYEKGIALSQKAVAIFEKINNTRKLAECYADYAKYGSYDYDVSLGFIDKALGILKKDSTIKADDIARTIIGRIRLHKKFQKYEAVEKDIKFMNEKLRDDLSIRKRHNLEMEHAMNKHDLEKYEASIVIAKQNINSSLADINPYLPYSYDCIVNSYAKLNQWDSAYHYKMLHQELITKKRGHEAIMKMKDLEAKYEDEKKQMTIAAQKQTITKQNIIQWLGIGASFLLGLLLFQTYRNGQQKRKANEQLVELDNLKTRLYTNITHEFRTPLTVILGMAAQVKTNPSKYLTSGTALIQKNGERLMELINQMLDLSKLESGAMTLNNIQSNIIDYISYLSQSVESFAAGKRISVHFYPEEDEVVMDYDEEKLKTIFTNLFSNSIKFTPEGGNIYIKTRLVAHGKNPFLKINFKDTGKGISEEKLPFIFNRFYQTDSGNTRMGEGTGIGLALVMEYTTLMGGEVSVKSKEGKETEFTILLPITRKARVEVNSKSESDVKLKPNKSQATFLDKSSTIFEENKATILLIEDNLDVATYVASCLDQEYNIIIGNEGKEGVELAIQYIPDIIITDIMMPLKDGFEVCQDVKTNQLTSHIPLIMLTAKADYVSKLEGLKYGADAYLEKPFNKEELQTRLLNLLSSRDKIQKHYLSLTNLKESTQSSVVEEPTIEDEFVISLTSIVNSHISDTDFSVELFAKKVGMSSSQLHRKVSGVTGLSPNRFIRHIRLTNAKNQLKTSDKPISNIAYDNGFNDPGYFGRVFKKEFGMTPQQWRQS